MDTTKSIFIDKNINRIQEIRLIQALAESSYSISIPKNELFKYKWLCKNLNFNITEQECPRKSLLYSKITSINHQAPKTVIGTIERPLIFPHEICSYLMNRWPKKRKHDYSFAGILSSERQLVLQQWIRTNYPDYLKKLSPKRSIVKKIANRILGKFGYSQKKIFRHRNFLITTTSKGRNFPYKAWDSEYYKVLLESKFTLCPSGDFIWTYRFFEAILCGSIPVVEETCILYEGFYFFDLSSDVKTHIYSIEHANENFAKAKDLLTVDKAQLDLILQRMSKDIEFHSKA